VPTKDVKVYVTGVSMSIEAELKKNDDKRAPRKDKEATPDKEKSTSE
jgi:hypothetical protein